MQIQTLRNIAIAGVHVAVDTLIDVDEQTAHALVRIGKAAYVHAESGLITEATVVDPAAATAEQPKAPRKRAK
ncbi:MAG: hypothetical protein KF832_25235 [Caldilineaceae bacterium]|nr:hypothetical protein [Caldilineaceae bacterium]